MPFVPASPPPDMPPPEVIFERAEAVWHAQKLPPYIEFTTYIAQISPDPVRVAVRTIDGQAFVQTIPLSPQQRPVAYPGVHLVGPDYSPLGICVSVGHCTGVLGSDPFGEQVTSPPNDLRTIAKTRVFVNPYQVISAQYMDFDGAPVYDLKLRAQQDPDRYRMREIVVDAQTYHVWKMMYEEPQSPNRLLTYGFGPVEDLWYLRQTCRSVTTNLSGLSVPACTPNMAMMWDYDFPAQIPAYFFDRQQFIEHAKQTAPEKASGAII